LTCFIFSDCPPPLNAAVFDSLDPKQHSALLLEPRSSQAVASSRRLNSMTASAFDRRARQTLYGACALAAAFVLTLQDRQLPKLAQHTTTPAPFRWRCRFVQCRTSMLPSLRAAPTRKSLAARRGDTSDHAAFVTSVHRFPSLRQVQIAPPSASSSELLLRMHGLARLRPRTRASCQSEHKSFAVFGSRSV
jgi:hypothetical protein